PDEIDILIAEAASAAGRDQQTKELIGLRNRLESLTRNTQRTYREVAGSLSADEREDAQQVLTEAAECAQSEDEEELRRVLGGVERIAAVLTTALFNSPGMSAGGQDRKAPVNGQDAKNSAFERF
ncbi:MAG TPA: Hsp70 family protein, partial [Pyrinomonadaceae bacterium]|nr:Hsp70 family protein [Pyrinomonadaceae bacterium]